ncbi:SRPBCC domain-containing protein [Rapidithrix thailandica]|uniref:SRPBCC domain-containing protein n=1 Tax=Rapidithrix thailandica TaxID=413964 RepID=A0AAW9SA75_9BACT
MEKEKYPIIKKEILFNASKAKVWEVLTSAEKIKEYMFGTTVISDWKADTPILFTGTWEGKPYEDKGTIRKFEPEKLLQYDYWSNFSGIADIPENYILLTFRLSEQNGATKMIFTQENSATQTMYEHSLENWEAVFNKMKALLEA